MLHMFFLCISMYFIGAMNDKNYDEAGLWWWTGAKVVRNCREGREESVSL